MPLFKRKKPKIPTDGKLRFTSDVLEATINAVEGDEFPSVKVLAYRGGVIAPENWGPVVINLAGMNIEDPTDLVAEHSDAMFDIVGDGTPVNSGKDLRVEGRMLPVTDAGKQVFALHMAGRKFQASVGLNVSTRHTKYIQAGETVSVNGRTITAKGVGFTLLNKTELKHVGLVRRGADSGSRVKIAAQAAEGFIMDEKFKAWLEANEYKPDEMTEKQLKPLEAQFAAETAPPEKKTPPPLPAKKKLEAAGGDGADADDYLELQAAQRERIAKIDAACEGHPLLAAQAIREKWSVEKAELEVLRASRPKAPAGHVHAGRDTSARVLEAAACRTIGLNVDEDYDEKTLEACDKQFRRGIGLQEMLILQARANGYTGDVIRMRTTTEIRQVLHAAFSEAAISDILSNVANKSILQAFNFVESTWRDIAKIGSVSDFKTHTRVRLTGDLTYEELGETGEIRHGKIADDSFTISANTYAKMLVLTRKDIINDDMGALDGVRTKIGRGAALKINNIFWTEFLDNSTFFTTARGNLLEGTANALDSTDPVKALDNANQKFLDQTDPDGDPVGIDPRVMLVPTALTGSAGDLFQSTRVVSGGSSSKNRQPDTNRWAGQFDPKVSRYLSNSNYTGYSSSAWYLIADPNDVATIEIVFLNGQQSPTVESADVDFNQLGIQMRGYHDFGVSKQEYRGAVKVTGVAAA
jgi:phage major head subunit gpT-like protein